MLRLIDEVNGERNEHAAVRAIENALRNSAIKVARAGKAPAG